MNFCIFFFHYQAISCKGQHSISYTLSRNQTVVVEYTHDKDTDMFQVTSFFFHGNFYHIFPLILHFETQSELLAQQCLVMSKGEKVKIILKLFLFGFQKTKETVLKLQKEIIKTTFSDLSAIERDSKNKNRDFQSQLY